MASSRTISASVSEIATYRLAADAPGLAVVVGAPLRLGDELRLGDHRVVRAEQPSADFDDLGLAVRFSPMIRGSFCSMLLPTSMCPRTRGKHSAVGRPRRTVRRVDQPLPQWRLCVGVVRVRHQAGDHVLLAVRSEGARPQVPRAVGEVEQIRVLVESSLYSDHICWSDLAILTIADSLSEPWLLVAHFLRGSASIATASW